MIARRTGLSLALATALASSGCGAGRTIERSRVVAASTLAWRDVVGPDGAPLGLRTTDVWGDARTGPHGSLTTLPAGLSEPLHTHSRAFRVLVLSGTMAYRIDGLDSGELPAGSYVVIAPGVPHLARCTGSAPCTVFVEQDGPLDVRLVGR